MLLGYTHKQLAAKRPPTSIPVHPFLVLYDYTKHHHPSACCNSPFLLNTQHNTQPSRHGVRKAPTRTLRQEYDDICNSNISSRSFIGKENEDPSETSCTFESSFELKGSGSSSTDLDMETHAGNEEEEEAVEVSVVTDNDNVEMTREAKAEEETTLKACKAKVDPVVQVQELQAQLQALERQLADRDSQLLSVHRQLEQERRIHDRLRFHWHLFIGKRKNERSYHSMMSCSCLLTPQNSSSSSCNSHICHGQSAGESKANNNFFKMVQLSVALAESKAQVSTLRAQLEESQNLVLHHSTGTLDS